MTSDYTLRLDPWSAEYEASIRVAEETEGPPVDLHVEQEAWRAVRPAAGACPPRLAFVDGVRRVEHRLLVTRGGRTVHGILGSYAVGAVGVEAGAARVTDPLVARAAVVGGGEAIGPLAASVGRGRPPILFEPHSVAEADPVAPVAGLQALMRRREAELAERLSAAVDVVFQDGPLSFLTAPLGSVVGFVKTQHRAYVDAAAQALLPGLAVGERTPIFLIAGREPRYAWYQRIAVGRPIESALAGVVRLESLAGRGLEEARRLADVAAREIPRFASDRAHDPRAPQNLHPIGGLEARLKHLLGDPLIVRRAVEAQLHSEVTA